MGNVQNNFDFNMPFAFVLEARSEQTVRRTGKTHIVAYSINGRVTIWDARPENCQY